MAGMTAAGWLTCTDPDEMLRLVQDAASDRKLLLYGCAANRSAERTAAWKKVVEMMERYADGEAGADEEVRAARESDRIGVMLIDWPRAIARDEWSFSVPLRSADPIMT